MIVMPKGIEFSCQEREVVLCKTLCSKGKCFDNESVAFAKNFKQ